MHTQLSARVRISLVNLFLVACLGVLMRYKIGFAFPYFDQTNLQHAHSHFAFYGWVTHTLMTLMILFLAKSDNGIQLRPYNLLIWANLLSAYGMLISFSISGYNWVSIFFSTTSLIVSYFFITVFIRDVRKLSANTGSVKWFQAALVFNVLSSFGTLALAYMMATRNIPQHWYLASVYFYLHFQYNGWFFFAAMGLLQLYFQTSISGYKDHTIIFRMFAFSCVPAYFLSALWMSIPLWIYCLIVMAALVQFVAWVLFVKRLFSFFTQISQHTPVLIRYLLLLISIALTVKFSLQLASVIPSVSKLAFGFRPIVIAYLHLVLLAIISLFLLTFMMANRLIPSSGHSKRGLILLAVGIYCTEIMLAVQGIASLRYTSVPYTNDILFGLALIMFSGISMLLLGEMTRKEI